MLPPRSSLPCWGVREKKGDSPVAKGESEKGGLVGGEIAWRYTYFSSSSFSFSWVAAFPAC